MRLIRLSVILVLALGAASNLRAGNCSWSTTPSTLSFGSYSVFYANAVVTVPFAFRCTPNQYANLKLTTGSGGVFTPYRKMSGAGTTANYNICLDANCSQIWGDANGGTYTYDVYNSTPQNKDFTDSMYGVIPDLQDLPVGTYRDTVYATLSYSTNPGGPFASLPPVAIAVSATVSDQCRLDTFNLAFGPYDPFNGAALSATSTVKVYCTIGTTPLTVGLDVGAHATGAQPRMYNGTDYLNYNPSLAAAVSRSTSSVAPINGGFSITATLPAGQDVSTGNYSDSLQALVNY